MTVHSRSPIVCVSVCARICVSVCARARNLRLTHWRLSSGWSQL